MRANHMQDQGLSSVLRHPDLGTEGLKLKIELSRIPARMIIQSRFSERIRLFEACPEIRKCGLHSGGIPLLDPPRMQAEGSPDPISVSGFQDSLSGPVSCIEASDHHAGDSSLLRTQNETLGAIDHPLIAQVAMGIDECHHPFSP